MRGSVAEVLEERRIAGFIARAGENCAERGANIDDLATLEAIAHKSGNVAIVSFLIPAHDERATKAGQGLFITMATDPAVRSVTPTYEGFDAVVDPLGYAQVHELVPYIEVLPEAV